MDVSWWKRMSSPRCGLLELEHQFRVYRYDFNTIASARYHRRFAFMFSENVFASLAVRRIDLLTRT